MTVYVIARRDASELDTVISSAGKDDAEEAVAVFTDEQGAAEYLFDADWGDSYTVAEIAAQDLWQWLCALDRDGIQYLTINPKVTAQSQGMPWPMVGIRAELKSAGESLCDRLQSLTSSGSATELQEIVVYHCQICGHVLRIKPGNPAPICCGQPAEMAAIDTESSSTSRS